MELKDDYTGNYKSDKFNINKNNYYIQKTNQMKILDKKDKKCKKCKKCCVKCICCECDCCTHCKFEFDGLFCCLGCLTGLFK